MNTEQLKMYSVAALKEIATGWEDFMHQGVIAEQSSWMSFQISWMEEATVI